MAELPLINAAQSENLASLQELIASDASVDEQDEHGWTALHWAAGKGNLRMLEILIEKGADVSRVGRDQRTPYMIALAAGHVEVLDLLRQAEASRSQSKGLKYCRAFPLGKLRRFEGWSTDEEASVDGRRMLTDDDLLFLHQDYSVTESMWHNESVVFADVSNAWKDFCTNELGFRQDIQDFS